MFNRELINSRSRSEWETLITEWIHDARDRSMLRRRMLDGLTFEDLADEFCLSVTQTKERVYRAQRQLLNHI